MNYVSLDNKQYYVTEYVPQDLKYHITKYTVPIYIDPYKEYLIRIKVEDSIGNIKIIDNKTHIMPDVIGYLISKNNENTIIKPLLSYYPDEIEYKIIKIDAEGVEESLGDEAIYSYRNNEYASQPESLYFCVLCKEGKAKDTNAPYAFKSDYGDTCILRKSNGSWTYGEVSQSQLSQSDIPPFELRISQAKPDCSGIRKVYVDYDKNFTFNPAYSYYVNVDGVYYSENEISLKTRNEPYSISLAVVNKNGQTIESASRSIDLSYDNIAPEIFLMPAYFVNGQLIMKTVNPIKDEGGSGLKMNNGKPLVQYLILTDSSKIPSSINEWKTNPYVKTADFIREYDDKTSDSSIHRMEYKMEYYDTFPQIIIWYTEDNNGNGIIETRPINYLKRPVINQTNIELQDIKYNKENNTFIETYKNGRTPLHKYISNSKWKNISDDGKYSYTLSDENGESSSFIRIVNFSSVLFNVAPLCYVNNIPYYYYPPYIKARDTGNPMVCDLKDLYIGQAGVNILADQPCFVHTMYCPNKLENTPEAWLNGGIETGLVIKQKSFTYSYDNLSGVPDGYYYTTIVHFADGTMLMTDVKKM